MQAWRRDRAHYFALKAADEVPNWSPLSNVTSATAEDAVPPATVTDLGIASKTETSATLHWTAPGDNDRTGTAAEYDLRYFSDVITEQTWQLAVRVQGVPPPSISGTAEAFTVTGLEPGQPYFLALKTVDDAANWSGLSNVVDAAPGNPLRRLTFSITGIAASPNWSPDGTKVAFQADWGGNANSDIYWMPVAGGVPVRLTTNPGPDSWPSWSPDGQRIAFSSRRGNQFGLWVINAISGSDLTMLVPHDGQPSYPAWSPDGSRIAYDVEVPSLHP